MFKLLNISYKKIKMNDLKRRAGISLVALIITIIVLIILTAAVILVGVNTPDNNEYAVKMHNKATLQDAVTLYVMTEMLNDMDNFVITSTGATKARDVADVVKDLYENGNWKEGAEIKLGVSMTLQELNTLFELDDQAVVTFAAGQEPSLDGTEGGNNNNEQSGNDNNQPPVTLSSVLSGKNFSILGDSISTYKGYSNNATNTNSTIGSNNVYYNGSNGLTNVNDTWWMQTVNDTGMNLLVNNSWSGSYVTGSLTSNSTGVGTRTQNLHDDTGSNAGTKPDIIAVYMGTNDLGKTVGDYSASDFYDKLYVDEDATTFARAYAIMLDKIQKAYPDAEIFTFTILANNWVASTVNENINNAIKTISNHYGATVVDIYTETGITSSNASQYMLDNEASHIHPNASGMDKITEAFINALEEKYL